MTKLTVVIPAWNCSKTIARLLDSIIIQGWSQEDLQVVICDDKSTDNWTVDILPNYTEKLNIKLCTTKDREIHCPGNTRLDAMDYVDSEWVTFIDNDDAFEPEAFNRVFRHIEATNEDRMICANFREWNEEEQRYTREFIGEETWLHGKWYNVKFLRDNNINFLENLESHEDLYFNSLVLGHLIGNDTDYNYLDEFVYKWIYRPDSLSRKYFSEEHYYIEVYLVDYIHAIVIPYFALWDVYKQKKQFFEHQILMCLLHAYFYYQSFVWRLGNNILMNNYLAIEDLVLNMQKIFGMSLDFIIEYIYSDPALYTKIKASCREGSCNFIEVVSFKDFIKQFDIRRIADATV